MALNEPNATGSYEAARDYQSVPASTAAVLVGQVGVKGGSIGDYVRIITIVPTTLSPGAVTLQDGTGVTLNIYAGGASSLLTLQSFQIFLDLRSVTGAWKLTVGAAMSVIVSGDWK